MSKPSLPRLAPRRDQRFSDRSRIVSTVDLERSREAPQHPTARKATGKTEFEKLNHRDGIRLPRRAGLRLGARCAAEVAKIDS
jgi:hypothetical protein